MYTSYKCAIYKCNIKQSFSFHESKDDQCWKTMITSFPIKKSIYICFIFLIRLYWFWRNIRSFLARASQINLEQFGKEQYLIIIIYTMIRSYHLYIFGMIALCERDVSKINRGYRFKGYKHHTERKSRNSQVTRDIFDLGSMIYT